MYRLTILSLRYPRATALALLLVTLLLAMGIPRVRTEFGYRVLIGDDHPSIQTLDRFIQQFGGGLPLSIAWECGEGRPCKSVFDEPSLRMAEAVRERLEALDVVARIDVPSHSPLLVPGDSGFEVRRFVEAGKIAPDSEELALLAVTDSLWVGTLVSEDALVGAMQLQASDTTSETEGRIVASVRAALRPHEENGFEFYLVGDAVATVLAGVALAESMNRLIPVLVLTIAAVIALLTGSVKKTAAALITMALALIWSFGLLGWIGWPQDGILEVLAPLILTVGVCDAIHLLSSLKRPDGISRQGSMIAAATDVSSACTLTTLTTAAAFLSFATSDLETFVRFGCISAFAVLACLILTFSALPIVCLWLRVREGAERSWKTLRWEKSMRAAIDVAHRRALPILVSAAFIVGVCAIGWISKLEVDNDWLESLGEQSEVTRWIRFVEERLQDAAFLEVEIDSGRPDSLEGAIAISEIDAIASELETVPGLGSAKSVANFMKRLNRLMHDDSNEFEEIPSDPRATAELLELLTIGDSSLLDPWMTPDRRRFRISVESPLSSYSSRKEILGEARRLLDRALKPGWSATLTGVLTINHDWVRDIQATQLRSFPTAFVLVLVMVTLFLRSLRLGLLAMIPALLPVVITLGAMGWMGMSLDVGRAMIAVVIIGIAVDDSIHLLSQYRSYAMRGHGPAEAMKRSVAHVGRAIVTTSLALAIGFLTLMLSAWQTISSFGFFVALAILGALAATLFVVPALIFVLDRGRIATDDGRATSPSPSLRRPSRKSVLTVISILPGLVALGIAAHNVFDKPLHRETDCWLLPTGRVSLFPGVSCPLEPHGVIRSVRWGEQPPIQVEQMAQFWSALDRAPDRIEVATVRGVEEAWSTLSVHTVGVSDRVGRLISASLLGALLLWLPLVLARGSSAPAALPFAFFYAALSVIAVAVMAARDSIWLNRAALLATTLSPAILIHLSFTFPRARRVAMDSPGLLLFPYVVCVGFFPAALLAMERTPLLWPAVVYLLISLSLAAWLILVSSCAFAMRESTSPIEKARARLLVWGALLLPLAGVLLTAGYASGTMATLAALLAFSVALIPLPIGVAVSRYNLFNLRQDARLWTAKLVFCSVAAFLVTGSLGSLAMARGLLGREEVPLLFAFSLAGVALLEPLRRHLVGWMEGLLVPNVERLRSSQARYIEQMAQLRSEDDVARLLADTLAEGLEPRWGCVLLASSEGWRPAHVFGMDEPLESDLVEAALSVLEDDALIHAVEAPEEETDPAIRVVCAEGIEVAAAIQDGLERLGFVLLAHREGEPYSDSELDFVSVATAHAFMALRNARFAGSLLAAEREAAAGRTALALAHGVTKDIGLIQTLARRVGLGPLDSRRNTRDMSMIQDLARELEENVRGFVRDATRGRLGILSLGEVIDQSARAVSRVHGRGRVGEKIEASLRPLRVNEKLEHILTNLLDNGLLASAEGEAVQVTARTNARFLTIEVSDRGCGMDEVQRRDAFALGYTTRGEEGGLGVGLAVSRDIAEGLGGSLDLAANSGGGTVATVRLPLVI